jgi:hypothetical protein
MGSVAPTQYYHLCCTPYCCPFYSLLLHSFVSASCVRACACVRSTNRGCSSPWAYVRAMAICSETVGMNSKPKWCEEANFSCICRCSRKDELVYKSNFIFVSRFLNMCTCCSELEPQIQEYIGKIKGEQVISFLCTVVLFAQGFGNVI